MIDKIELTIMLVSTIGAMIGMISCGIVATVAARTVDWTEDNETGETQ